MQIELNLPEDVVAQLRRAWGDDLDRGALEAVVVQGYRDGALTAAQVRRLLGLGSRIAADAWMKEKGAYLHYSEEDLESDVDALRSFTDR